MAAVDVAGILKSRTLHMANIKLYFDYPKRKDGFMGRENRRYWLLNTETGDKLKITEKQYDALNGLEWFHASS